MKILLIRLLRSGPKSMLNKERLKSIKLIPSLWLFLSAVKHNNHQIENNFRVHYIQFKGCPNTLTLIRQQ